MGCARRIAPGRGTRAGKLLKLTRDAGGRLVFNVSVNGKRHQLKIHRAVALTFLGPNPPGMEVAHLDGDQENNRLKNLIYATPTENNGHKVAHGTQPRGSDMVGAKLTEDAVAWIKRNRGSVTQRAMAKQFGVSEMAISQIFTGRTWKHVHA